MRERITILIARSVILFVIGSIALLASARISSAMDQAVWVWPDKTTGIPIIDIAGRQTLISNASQSGVTELFVSVYSTTPNASGRKMFADAVLNDLIQKAHARRPSIESGRPTELLIGPAQMSAPTTPSP